MAVAGHCRTSACLNVMRLLERKSPMGENRKRDREGEDSVAGLSVLLCVDGLMVNRERLPAATKVFPVLGMGCGVVMVGSVLRIQMLVATPS